MAKSGTVNFYNGVATQSLRCDPASNPKLVFTPSSASNRKTWTWSCWVKRCSLGSAHIIFNVGVTGSDEIDFHFTDADQFIVSDRSGHNLKTAQVFRDTSAWYNLVVVMDTVQSGVTFDSANALKIYVNGVRVTSFASGISLPDEDDEFAVNNTKIHHIATRNLNDNDYNGYIAEMNLVDGLALDSSYFGETKNGAWIPKKYTGSYGTNGWRLQFDQTGVGTASTSTIGADTSGNTHHFTSSGIVASDCNMPDSPENNFCTWSPLTIGAQGTLAEGNLKNASFWSADLSGNASTFFPESGKWYWELRVDVGGTYPYIGITSQEKIGYSVNGGTFYSIGWSVSGASQTSGSSLGTVTKENIPSFADNDIMSFALDCDARKIWVAENNTYADSGDPANGTGENASWTLDVGISPFISGYQSQGVGTVANFGQDGSFAGGLTGTDIGEATDGNGKGLFKYAPPSGFLSLCTANLPEPTIGANSATQADDHFNTVLYTGASSGQGITGVGFQPDWTWIKSRSHASSHVLTDSNRGVTKSLFSDTPAAESTLSGGVTAFGTDGFTLGTEGTVNTDTRTYVAWNWKANGGTTVTNEAGSIDSTVQANTDAGFSIVTYTASASSDVYTIGHGLSQAPELIINKDRDSAGAWWSFTTLIDGSVDYVRLDDTNAKADDTASLGVPTTSVFSQVENYTPASSNNVAYCFHSVEGYSKFGSFTGNGNVDGTFVYLGFRPAFIMYKRTDTTGNWLMDDNKTSTFNYDSNYLLANSSDVEGDTTTNTAGHMFDHLSNGFKMRNTNADRNASGGTYIYMAFAESSMKYSNGR